MNRAVVWLVALALLSLSSATTAAQVQSTPQTTVLLDFGFAGTLPSDEWAPVRIAISAMDDPIEAVARIRVLMPDGGSITSLIPLATTPGRETLVPATIWVPSFMTSVVVDLLDSNGTPIASTSYGTLAGAQSIRLPLPSAMPIILSVGSPSVRLAFGETTYEREFVGERELALKDQAAIARVASAIPPSSGSPPWLPTQAMAYSGVSVLVLDGQMVRTLLPGSVLAIREWIVSGGRMLVANADTNALRALLGEYTPAAISIGPPIDRPLSEPIGGPGMVLARSFDTSTLPPGWSSLPEAPELVVEGPVGLGWVMLLGFDPDALAEADQIEAVEKAWHETLATVIAADLEQGQRRLGSSRWEVAIQSEVAARMSRAWVTRAPVVGMGAFLAIFAMMLFLGLALGPIDRYVLRRTGMLSRWWLMALVWITIASIGAWVLPAKVRSGPTTVSSIRVIDAIDDGTTLRQAWQVAVDGMFLNQPARLAMDDLDTGSWLAPMLDPWDSAGTDSLIMLPKDGTMKPQPTSARMWTTRSFQQAGPTNIPIQAGVDLTDGVYTLRLRGEQVGSIDQIAIHTADEWLHMLPGGSPQRNRGELRLQASTADLVAGPPQAFDGTTGWEERYGFWSEAIEPDPHVLHSLSAAEQRTKALQALGSTKEWAVVYGTWKDNQASFAPDIGEEYDTLWTFRIAVRVQGSPAAGGGTP